MTLSTAPLPFLENLAREQPDLVTFRDGEQSCVLVIHPDLVMEVLGPLSGVLTRTPPSPGTLIGPSSFNTDGAIHKEMRARVVPALTGGIVSRARDITEEEAGRALESLGGSEPIDLVRFLGGVVTSIMERLLFGSVGPGHRLITALNLMESGTNREEALRLRREVDAELSTLLAKERDLSLPISVMGSLSRAELGNPLVFSEVVAHFLSGYDALTNTLAWAWIEEKKSTMRVMECDGRALFNETLRLYPPGWLFNRRATGDCSLKGTTISEGTMVFLCPYLSHRDSRFFPSPEIFDPGRWDKQKMISVPPYYFFPFGGGNHRCTGEALSYAIGVSLLTLFSKRLIFERVENEPVEIWARGNTALRPGRPVLMKIKERS